MENNLQIILETPRLIIRLPDEDDSVQFKSFYEKNKDHLSPWMTLTASPKINEQDQLIKWTQEFKEGKSIRFLIFIKNNPEGGIIGFCNFTQIFRGFFQACYLGYHIDANFEGKGLMSEALAKAVEYMFEKQNLHRIMANYMPSNKRSAKLLHHLGFLIEGQAKKYLHINGSWQDHVLTALTNENWKD